ncbi:MAG: PilN domain-containing protein [Gemmatimonadota bacterium]|nr:PilN domain-containing protein [Gemmatimonadota bacterium]MDH4348289.1 PilN domain-containing protein [Gemmatimonadota bacterium]MDH5283582.1 PilN domain-containing protein [Gemmatimonadota bacterium]
MMITVNLRPGQKRRAAGGGGAEVMARLKALGARVKDPYLVGSVAACAGVALWIGFSLISTNATYGSLGQQLEQAQEDHRRFDNLLKQKRRSEMIRDSLLAQITTIRGIDGNRYVWPHIFDEVAKALPPYTWLTTVTAMPPRQLPEGADSTAVPPLVFRIEGRTMDLQAYTRFLRQLEASPWVAGVTPMEAKTIVDKERPVTQFSIQAEFDRADSAYIRTVPLTQSVR